MDRLFDTVVECREEVQATVKGDFPEWVKGNLYRVGSGKFDQGDFTVNHWFDGYAILYRLNIKDKKVLFKSAYLDTDAYTKFSTVERPVFTEFGTRSFPDPCKNVFSRFFSQLVPIEMTDNVMANVYPLGDEIFCATETCYIWRVDPDNLEAIEKVDISKNISVNLASSHPIKSEDGTSYNLGTSLMTGLKYHIMEIPPPQAPAKIGSGQTKSKSLKKASLLATIPSSWKTCISYYHSFGASENYFVFVEQPLLVNVMKLATSGVKGLSLKECMDWEPNEKTRFYVIERSTGHVLKTKYISEPIFLFHHINAYEEDCQLVVDVVAFEDSEIVDKFYLEKMRANIFENTNAPQPSRFVIPLETDVKKGENLVTLKNCQATAVKQEKGEIFLTREFLCDPGKVTEIQMDDPGSVIYDPCVVVLSFPPGFELPTVNPKNVGKKYRYVYGSGVFERTSFKNSACKLDVETKELKQWHGTETMYPGELTFLPNPSATTEDDGILLTVVIDVEPDSSDFLLVLDAKTMTERARAEVNPQVRIPFTLHNLFLPQT